MVFYVSHLPPLPPTLREISIYAAVSMWSFFVLLNNWWYRKNLNDPTNRPYALIDRGTSTRSTIANLFRPRKASTVDNDHIAAEQKLRAIRTIDYTKCSFTAIYGNWNKRIWEISMRFSHTSVDLYTAEVNTCRLKASVHWARARDPVFLDSNICRYIVLTQHDFEAALRWSEWKIKRSNCDSEPEIEMKTI